jgi:uncharacterized protein YkwD
VGPAGEPGGSSRVSLIRVNVARLTGRIGLAFAGLAVASIIGGAGRDDPAERPSRGPALRLRFPELSKPIVEKLPDPSRPADPVKAAVLARINEDRRRNGLGPVAWDEGASRVSDAFCARQVEEKSRGHYLMDGVPPYGRLSFAGIFALSAENSASWVTTESRFSESTVVLALDAERTMMEEKPPADGHRKTILDPDATHVGVGYAIHRGRFQMSEEFLTRRMERMTVASSAQGSASVVISGQPVSGSRLRFVTIAREPVPRGISREEATSRTSYGYPSPFLAFIPEGRQGMRVSGVPTEDRVRLMPGDQFSFSYTPDRPGLYTFSLYVASGGDTPRPGGSATIWVE